MNGLDPDTQRARAERFRDLHDGPGAFVIPNPWDIGSAHLLAELGFKALATTSAGFAFTLGLRDGAVTRDEALDHAAAIVAATDLPVSADLENGFGPDPEDAATTIRAAIATGLVGASIEDASGDPAQPIYDHGHSVERVAAAVEAARTAPFPFMLTARAENFLHGRADLDDTLKRLQAYEAAGADVLYAPGLPDLDAVRIVCEAATRPVNVLASPLFTVADLESAGATRISLGGTLARVAVHAFLQAARVIRDKGSFAFADHVPPFSALTQSFPGNPDRP